MMRFLLCLAVIMGLASNAFSEMLPSFEMNMMADRADCIVAGVVGQNTIFVVDAILKGQPARDDAAIRIDPEVVKRIRTSMGLGAKAPLKIVAFLDASGRPVWGVAGLVALQGKSVWLCQDSWGRGSLRHTEDKAYTDSSFIEEVKKVLAVIATRKTLAGQTPSKTRVAQILQFLEGKDHYQLSQLVRDIRSITAEEETELLAILKAGANDTRAGIILNLAGKLPFRAASYDDIAVFIRTGPSGAIRRNAIAALPRIDMSRVADSFGPFLKLDEPALKAFLTHLEASPGKSVKHVPDAKVLAPLLSLIAEMRQHHAEHGRQALNNESRALLNNIHRYAHPQFIALIHDWALKDDHVTSNQALSTLRALTGLSYGRQQKSEWNRWLEASRDALSTNYVLSTEAGRRQWLNAWVRSDEATQRLLMRLWLFGTSVPEAALLDTASGKDRATAEGAKHVLSALWQHKRLSAKCRKELVVRFLHLSLVQQPSQRRGLYHLKLAADPQFPFPKDSWVQPQCAWSLSSTPPKLGNSYGAFSLHDVDKVVVGSRSGGGNDSSMVRAAAELREVERGSRGNVLWSHQWSFGPTPMKDIPNEDESDR